MSWFKVDDKLWGHPKWLATPIRARGLWVTAGSWSADQEQDGNVPRHVLPMLGGTVRDASALVASGLWTASDAGWCFHGWAEFQPTREQKEADRSAARERMRAARERKAGKRAEDVRPNNSEVRPQFERSSEDVRSTPTRPDPTRKEEKNSSSSDVEAGFAEFWEHYPRKVGKAAAALKYRTALKKITPEDLLAAVIAYEADPNQPPKEEIGAIPHPSTWLHQERWNDPPLPPRLSKKRQAPAAATQTVIDGTTQQLWPANFAQGKTYGELKAAGYPMDDF